MKKDAYNLEESLGYIVGRTGRSMAHRLNQNFEKGGQNVTCEQWSILHNLWIQNGQNQKDLAALTCKDKTNITRLIHGLEKRKLVVRIPGKDDGRQKLIYLTKKGKDLQQGLLFLVQKTLNEAQDGIKAEDLKVCKEVLRKVAQNLS